MVSKQMMERIKDQSREARTSRLAFATREALLKLMFFRPFRAI